jgi:hypothetical protein
MLVTENLASHVCGDQLLLLIAYLANVRRSLSETRRHAHHIQGTGTLFFLHAVGLSLLMGFP